MDTLPENISAAGLINLKYPISGQEDGQGYLTSEPKEGSVGLVMIQEWWGMNKSITLTADNWAKLGGLVVLTPDLYRGKVAKNHEEAGHLKGGLDWEGSVPNIVAAIQYLKSKGCKKVGLTGFCMGGALTIATSSRSDAMDAAIAFYGVPDLNKFDASNIKCPFLGMFGSKDQMVGYSDITARQNLETVLKKGGVNYEIKVYDADHAFMNADGARFSPEASKEALPYALNFFKEKLN